jgi:hypothetical protein
MVPDLDPIKQAKQAAGSRRLCAIITAVGCQKASKRELRLLYFDCKNSREVGRGASRGSRIWLVDGLLEDQLGRGLARGSSMLPAGSVGSQADTP